MTINRTGTPLAPIGCQFALARPMCDLPRADPALASPTSFGLRFFLPVGAAEDAVPPPFRYDHERQLAVGIDPVATPLIDLPGLVEKSTTGYSDGKNPRGEEFRLDFTADHQR